MQFVLTNEEMIEVLKKKFDLKTDVEAALMLGISKQNFSDWRAGKRKLPAMAVVKGWDKIGYAASRDALLNLLGDAGEEIRRSDNRRALQKVTELSKKPDEGKEHAEG